MRAREFIVEVSLENIARTPAKGGMTMGDAVVASMPSELEITDPVQALELISSADPTNDNSLTKWLVRRYIDPNDGFSIPDDIDRVKSLLAKHQKLAQVGNLSGDHKNIDSFKTLDDLKQAMGTYGEEHTNTKTEKAKSGIEIITKEPGFMITKTTTWEGNRKVGSKTNWCTAADSDAGREHFGDYSSKGPLYQFIVGSGPSAKKYQYHYEKGEFNDAENEAIQTGPDSPDIQLLSKYPAYTNWLNGQIKEHYSKYFNE